MTELASAYVTIMPSLKGAQKTIERELGGVNVDAVGRKMGGSLVKSIGGGLATVGKIGVGAVGAIAAAVGGIAVSGGISRALKIDQAEMKFEALGLNVQDVMESCNKAVSGTAYGLDAAATVAASLGASGIKAGDEMTSSLKAVAGMAAMSGVSMEHIGLIFGKVAAQGRLQGDELLQFAENGVNASAALAKHLGITQSEVQELVSQGKVDFKTFSDAMYAAFGDAAQGANDTFQGAMSNVSAALSRIGAKFASPALESLRKVFVALIPAIDAVSKLLDPMVDRFAKFTEAVSGRAVSGIETFTKVLGETGSIMRAFRAGFMEAFEGTWIDTFITKLTGLYGLFKAGKTPADGLRLVIAGLQENFALLMDKLGNMSLLDTLREKIASLPQPVQNVISAIAGFGQKVAEIFSGISAQGAIFAALFAGIFLRFKAPIAAIAGTLLKFGSAAAGAFAKIGGLSGIVALVGSKLNLFGSAVALCGGGVRGFAVVVGSFLKGALMSILSPVGLVMAAIAALGAAFVYLMTTNEGFRSAVVGLVAQIGAGLAPILVIVGQALSNLASTVLPLISNAIALIVPVLGQIITIVLQVAAALAPLITTLVSVLVPIVTSIVQLIVTVAAQIIAAVMPVISSILNAIQAAMPLIQTIITVVMTAVFTVIQTVWPLIQTIITTVANVVLGIIQTVMPIIQGIFDRVMPAILSVIEYVWPAIQSAIEFAMNAIQTVIDVVMAVIQGDWEGAWDIVKNALSDAWEGIKSGVSDGIDAVMGFIQDLPGKITGFFSDAGSWLLDAGSSIIHGLWDGISGALGWLGDQLGGIGQFIADHKGPKQYDLKLLIPNGQWIMTSLTRGIDKGMPGLAKTLGGVTDSVADWSAGVAPFGDVDTNVKAWSRAEIATRDDAANGIAELLEKYLPGMAEEKQIVMDTGALAGALTKPINKNLGKLDRRAGALC